MTDMEERLVKMTAQIIESQVIDATHLELFQPIQIPPHSRIIVAVMTSDVVLDEREAWFKFAAEQFQAAYGESEPEYSLDMIREPNPEYTP
jgi:hypothetical protein